MYDRDVVELALWALEEGMTQAEAAAVAGVGRTSVGNWAAGRLPHDRGVPLRLQGRRGRILPTGGTRPAPKEDAAMGPSEREKGTYEPPRSGPLAGLEPAQIENLLLRAVLADLKAGGWDPASISNRRKCELGERLRRATGLPLRSITGFLRISKSSYEYHRARLGRPDRDADIRGLVASTFEEGRGAWGYRVVHARLRRAGVVASEKRVLRVMREKGLRPAYARRRRRYSSYAGEVSKAPPNLVGRNFHAGAPDELRPADITEFALPCGEKAYLSAVVDCFDGRPAGWASGPRPDAALADASLVAALAQRRPGARTTVHSDRGGRCRWPGWIAICRENGLTRSMSAKGCSPDNAAMEGFFGRLKNEFFYDRDWRGVGFGEFEERLDAYLRYYCEGRIKESLGWLSPDEYRRKLGYAS